MEKDDGLLSKDDKAIIRREVIGQATKWTIAAAIALSGFALAGWGLYFEPKFRDYIATTAGALPAGAIVASVTECRQLAPSGRWVTFTEGTGRFLVGAGTDYHSGYASWIPETGRGKIALTPYKVLEAGGEEKHWLTVPELPPHQHSTTLSRKWGDKSNQETGWGSDDGSHPPSEVQTSSQGGGNPHNNVPPFLAVYLCLKK